MQRILAIIEPSGEQGLAALAQAMVLAERDESAPEIVAMHHIFDTPAQIEKMFHGTYLKNLTRPLLEEAEKWAQEAVKPYLEHKVRANGSDISVRVEVLWENQTYRAVDKVCEEHPVDLIVKVADEQSSWLKSFFHSDDWHLLTHASSEVLMIDKTVTFDQGKLLVALDSFDPKHQALNQRILARAQKVAKTFDMHVCVLHAYPDINTLPTYGLELGTYVSDEMLSEIEARHQEVTNELLQGFDFKQLSTVVAPGPVAGLISDQIDGFKPDCLMIGNLSEKGVPGLIAHQSLDRLQNSLKDSALWVLPQP